MSSVPPALRVTAMAWSFQSYIVSAIVGPNVIVRRSQIKRLAPTAANVQPGYSVGQRPEGGRFHYETGSDRDDP
jgi:hypothetical protein